MTDSISARLQQFVADAPLTDVELKVLRICISCKPIAHDVLDKLIDEFGHDPDALTKLRQPVIALLALVSAHASTYPRVILDAWRKRLKGALALELARAKEFNKIVAPIVASERLRALEPIVIKGSAIAASCYPNGFHRHTSHFSLLVQSPDHFPATTEVMEANGCRLEHDAASGSRQLFRHSSGMPVFVFGGRPCNRLRDFNYDVIRPNAKERMIAGQKALVPSESALWTELVYSANVYGDHFDPQWIVDSVFLTREFNDLITSPNSHHLDSRINLPYRKYGKIVAEFID